VAHAFALFVAVSVGANISGGHVNPAVTFGAFVGGNITLFRGLLYWIAQLLGSTVACFLLRFCTGGLATGTFANRVTDDLALTGAIVVNAVKCLPPANKPTPEEIRTCRPFLDGEIAMLPNVRIVVALGQIAHQSAVKVMGGRLPKANFAHGAEHRMPDGRTLLDSYHPSRYNQNTGRLDEAMFESVFARAMALRQTS